MMNTIYGISVEKALGIFFGRTPEEHIITMNKKIFELFHNIFLALREKYGDKWREKYNMIWEELLESSFENTKKALGISEVKDIPTLGKIQVFRWTNYPLTCGIVEESPERVVIEATFCPNPYYGPEDCHMNKIEYYRNEAWLVEGLSTKLVELAKMDDWVEAKMEGGICLGHDVCRVIFQKKKDAV